MSRHVYFVIAVLFLPAIFGFDGALTGQESDDESKTTEVKLADGMVTMQAPDSWKTVKPRFDLIEAEFSWPKTGDDEKSGRMTIMRSGGTIKQNIDRWIGQFSQSDGSSTKDQAKTTETTVNGIKVHIVDITGTFADRPGGPVSPPTMRDDYRMLGAIIETDLGNYYVKSYGPKKTMGANEEKFKAFIKSLKAKQ